MADLRAHRTDQDKFLEQHRGEMIGSPALLGHITRGFVAELEAYTQANDILLVRFEKGERKDEVAARYRRRFCQAEGVVFIGVAQERVNGFDSRRWG